MIFFYLLVSIMPLVNHPLWSRFVGELTMTKFVGLACLVYAIIYRATRRSFPNLLGSPVTRLFLLFYFLSAVSYLWKGTQGPWFVTPLMTYSSFALMLFVTFSVVDSPSRLRVTLLVAIGSLAFASLYVIREWQQFHNLYAGYRPGWITGDPNYFTLSAVVCLPLAYYMLLESESWWSKAFCLGCLVVTLVGVTLAASRGGFVGLSVALLYIVWRSRQRVRSFILITALLIPIILFAPALPVQRFLHPSYGDQVAKDSRFQLWRAGLQMIKDEPLTGVGLGNFKPLVTRYEKPEENLEKIAHNTYIEIAAEMGIPSLLVFLAILFSVFRALGRAREHANAPPFLTIAATAMQASLVGCMASIAFISCEKQKLLWLLVFLAPCLEALADASKPEAALEPLSAIDSGGGVSYDIDSQELELTQ